MSTPAPRTWVLISQFKKKCPGIPGDIKCKVGSSIPERKEVLKEIKNKTNLTGYVKRTQREFEGAPTGYILNNLNIKKWEVGKNSRAQIAILKNAGEGCLGGSVR